MFSLGVGQYGIPVCSGWRLAKQEDRGEKTRALGRTVFWNEVKHPQDPNIQK